MPKKILVTGPVPPLVETKLKDEGFELDVRELKALVEERDLIEALKGKHGHVYGGYELMSAKAIESTDCLQVIAFCGAGYEKFVDVDAASRKGIIVTNTPGANKQSVAEMTMALILSCMRKVPYLNQKVRAGEWRTIEEGRELFGKTLGIIGMGTIGKRLAEIAHFGFNMEILYYSRTSKPDIETKTNAKMVSLDELLNRSDIVSLHCAYNSETDNIISDNEFSKMKPGAVLVNTARADLVDGKALYNALSNHMIAAAAFDGYYTEPNPPSPENDEYGLASLSDDLFLITPHNAWSTPEATESMFMMAAESVIDILNGKSNQYIVNP